jgi:hypothetical protein
MGKVPMCEPVAGEGLPAKCFVLIRRQARPLLPWVWEVHRSGHPDACWRAVRGYKSAEDAWVAGQSALARRGVQDSPEPGSE